MSDPIQHAFDGSTINLTLALSPDTVVGQRYISGGNGSPEDGPPEYEPISLLEAIVERTARILSENRELRVEGIKQQVAAAVDARLTELLAPILEHLLDEPLPALNAYGEPSKQTFTLRERIVAIAGKQLTIRANATRDYDKTTAEKWVGDEIDRAINKELAAEFAEVKRLLRARAAEAATTGMKAAIAKELGL